MPACPACTSENPPDAQFCSHCGASLRIPAPQYAPPVAPYQPVYVPRPLKDRSIALILEILPALFGIFGIGWIYAGNTSTGIIWLIGVLIWDVVAGLINILTGGFGCFCTLPVGLVLIALSVSSLNSYTKQHTELFGP
jgi:hypothetical protein